LKYKGDHGNLSIRKIERLGIFNEITVEVVSKKD